jgi:hypothetical protein
MRVDQLNLPKTSIHAGVSWDKRSRMWIAKTLLSDGRRRVQLGSFPTEGEAVRVLVQARADMADACRRAGSGGRGTTQEATDIRPRGF